MNFYVIGAVVTVLILGLFIVYANDNEQEYDRGYHDAVEMYRRQMQSAMWQQYLAQSKGGDDEEEQDE